MLFKIELLGDGEMKEILFNQKEKMSEDFSKLVESIGNIKIEDDMIKTQQKLSTFLKKMGYETKCSFPANDRGDGSKKGQINIIAYGLDKPIGICIDNKWHRKRSIAKLNSIQNIYRLLIVRNGNVKPLKEGIHAAVSLDIKDDKKKIGIYTITNLINEKVYVGSSIDLDSRLSNHKSKLYNNTHSNNKLQTDWNKFGDKNFSFKVIKLLNSETELPNEEKLLIDKGINTSGVYNISDPLEETHKGRFAKGKSKSIGFHKYSKEQIIGYFNQKFSDKILILHENIDNRKFYSKEKLDKWFIDNIDDTDIVNDYRIYDFLKSWYNKNRFSVLETRIWKSVFRRLYKINIDEPEYILVTQEIQSELYNAKYKK
jgi:group I intron endonuclease